MMIEMRQEVHSQFKLLMDQEIFSLDLRLFCKFIKSTISDNFEINAGMSTITIGTHNEFSSAYMFSSEIITEHTGFLILLTS
jgi:hypothetical protein